MSIYNYTASQHHYSLKHIAFLQLKEVSSTILVTSFVTSPMPIYETHMSHVTVTSVTPVTVTVTTMMTPKSSLLYLSTTKVTLRLLPSLHA